jgi:hypothetical protein
MRGEPLSAGWLSQWQPDADDRTAVAKLAREPVTPADPLTFHRAVGEIVLEDVGGSSWT